MSRVYPEIPEPEDYEYDYEWLNEVFHGPVPDEDPTDTEDVSENDW